MFLHICTSFKTAAFVVRHACCCMISYSFLMVLKQIAAVTVCSVWFKLTYNSKCVDLGYPNDRLQPTPEQYLKRFFAAIHYIFSEIQAYAFARCQANFPFLFSLLWVQFSLFKLLRKLMFLGLSQSFWLQMKFLNSPVERWLFPSLHRIQS